MEKLGWCSHQLLGSAHGHVEELELEEPCR